MDSDDGENVDYGDDIDVKAHEKLVEDVLNIHKHLPAKKPLRAHYTPKVSDLRVPRSVFTEEEETALDNDVLKGLKKAKKLKHALDKPSNKTLARPLEKPQAERIRRTVAYEKSRLKLDRWEPVVTANRVSSNLTFPLDHNPKVEMKEAKELTKTWRLKSKLQEELEKIDPPKVEVYEIDTEKEKNKVLQSMKGMLEHRNAMAKMRAVQSYKEAKARRQSKIKSKKYHRIQKRQKIKQQLKEFDELHKTNPEEALMKLDEIDRIRAQERFSLRHRSTGQWAKNKQIKAKYDKESREMLAQQLAIGRELKQKVKHVDDDSEDEAVPANDPSSEINQRGNFTKEDPNNIWISGVKPNQEVSDYIASYRQYWTQQNEKLAEGIGEDQKQNATEKCKASDNLDESEATQRDGVTVQQKEERISVKQDTPKENVIPVKSSKNSKKRMVENVENSLSSEPKRKKKKKNAIKGTREWNISKLDVEDIFEVLEDKLARKIKKKAKLIGKELKHKEKIVTQSTEKLKKKCDLSLPRTVKKPIIDEALTETTSGPDSKDHENVLHLPKNDNIDAIKTLLFDDTTEGTGKTKPKQNKTPNNVDLHNLVNVKATELISEIPDLYTKGEEESDDENNSQLEQLMDTFEDNNIINDFTKEKKEEIDKDCPKDIDLTLPGWGSWGGAGIKVSNRKRRRFIIKMPKKVPRRDDNKGMLIINEKAEGKIKDLKVADVPFPFSSVKDYEASLRAPIGRSFVPEKAFRKHIQPAVQTKMGAIIEPMSKDHLLNK